MPAQHQSALVSDIAHSHITVCMLCPICQRSYPHAAVHGHMEECLQQVSHFEGISELAGS